MEAQENQVTVVKNYDKPRIASTIVIGVFVSLVVILTIIILNFTWADVEAAVDSTAENSDSAAGAVVGGFAVALVMALGMALALIVAVANIIASSICLPFALKNRKSTLKAIRIISYVYDGVIALCLFLNILKIILIVAHGS